ncbi:MAG: hypothetical protein CMF24_05800 [Ilumatobacter sp.]|nr:hypothetical protein [Ilumatobacter sp.]MDG1392863.1 hypothetical protein [Ilumatobacter sp.]MDG1785368.1 hypothetical protein [Ilumatobacter sp.]MDG2437695.1 hypothetical protein [Ilumatobacter sp.]
MNSELATIEISTSATPARSPGRYLAALAVAVLGLSACNSDPGSKRVAEDIIKTAVVQGDLTEAQGNCMLDRVEAYSQGELDDITKSAGDAGPGTAIELFEADLAACK